MDADDFIYPPTYRKGPVGLLLMVLVFSYPLLLSAVSDSIRLTIADKIWCGAVLLIGGWFLGRTFLERRFYEKIYFEGIDVEAKILSPTHETWSKVGVPQAFGVFYRPLKVQYELDGETIVAKQDVSETVRALLSGRQTVDIRVHPEKHRSWVLMPF